MSSPAVVELERLLDMLDTASGPDALNRISAQLSRHAEEHPEAMRWLQDHRDDLIVRLDAARVQSATVQAQMGLLGLAIAGGAAKLGQDGRIRAGATPGHLPAPGARGIGGPAGERHLTAMHLLETCSDIVPLDKADLERAIDRLRVELHPAVSAGSPDAHAIARLVSFHSLMETLATGAYYLLHDADASGALASDPPAMEALPPLPFPRVWIEMCGAYNEPVPMVTYSVAGAHSDTREIHVLGVALHEVTPGREWDVLIPMRFDYHPEWSVLGMRIGPQGIQHVLGAPDEDVGPVEAAAWLVIRQIAIGGAHLISARNVPHDRVTLPRAQRKRIQ